MLNTKVSPKSCSCQNCLRGKHTKAGHYMMKCDERANRRAVKNELDKLRGLDYNITYADGIGLVPKHEYQTEYLESLNVPTVPIGNYYD